VNEPRTFSIGHLIDILVWVIKMHGHIEDKPYHSPNARTVLHAEGCGDITVQVNFDVVARLADSLRAVTAVDASSDLAVLAQVMANVATMVNHSGGVIKDGQEESSQLSLLAYHIGMEYSIACAVAFARFYGYNVSPGNVPSGSIALALVTKDWEQLVRTFEDSLRAAEDQGPSPEEISAENEDALIWRLERQFAEASPVPEPVEVNTVRQLSADSYFNLRSVAEQEHWSDAEVLMLIEEHLCPVGDANLVCSSIVSGADWRRLYSWVHREGGGMLWRVTNE